VGTTEDVSFLTKISSHPEWEVIRAELAPDSSKDYQITTRLGGGLSVIEGFGPAWDEETTRKSDLWGELCWLVTQGKGYCEAAHGPVVPYLKRLGAI